MSYEVVNTEHGPVKGCKKTSTIGRNYLNFQGIPYMKAPIGKLRFRDPQVPEVWKNPIDCTKEHQSYCQHMPSVTIKIGKEDAAVINVYTPEESGNELLPVFVYIHGGGFFSGSSKNEFCGPDYLMEKNIVLVTFNYRLGPIGFLSLSDPELKVPGNAGLKDQVFALKWIQKNIQAFKGDPNNVTLCGESAGAVSVHLHMISQQSRGLFHKAILISGSAFIKSWGVIDKNDYAERLAKKCGWDGCGGEEKLLEILENVNPHVLMKHGTPANLLTEEEYAQFMIFIFSPVIEPYESENCFIPKDPILMSREATWSKDMPCLIGGASIEGIMTHFLGRNEKYIDLLQNQKYFSPSRELNIKVDSDKAMKYGTILKDIYFKSEQPSMKNIKEFLRYAGDRHIWQGLYNAIKSREINCGKTFVFRFDASTELNFMKRMAKIRVPGAAHGDATLYLFSSSYAVSPEKDSIERKMIEKMTTMWTAFAATGNPNDASLKDEINWMEIKENDINCLNISEKKLEMIPLPNENTLQTWNSIFDEENILIF